MGKKKKKNLEIVSNTQDRTSRRPHRSVFDTHYYYNVVDVAMLLHGRVQSAFRYLFFLNEGSLASAKHSLRRAKKNIDIVGGVPSRKGI
jgi:hypothetical protein